MAALQAKCSLFSDGLRWREVMVGAYCERCKSCFEECRIQRFGRPPRKVVRVAAVSRLIVDRGLEDDVMVVTKCLPQIYFPASDGDTFRNQGDIHHRFPGGTRSAEGWV